MTYFERKGVELQENSVSVAEAIRRFNYSCQLCGQRGCRTSCACCPIAAAHEIHVDVLKFLAEERMAKERAAERGASQSRRQCCSEQVPQKPYRSSEEPVIPHPICLTIVI